MTEPDSCGAEAMRTLARRLRNYAAGPGRSSSPPTRLAKASASSGLAKQNTTKSLSSRRNCVHAGDLRAIGLRRRRAVVASALRKGKTSRISITGVTGVLRE
jgi:hypothetical protein